MALTRKNHVEEGPTRGWMAPVNTMEMRPVNSKETTKHADNNSSVFKARNDHQRKMQRNPSFVHLGIFGVRVTLGAAVVAAVVYVLSYYRYFIRIPETLDTAIRNREPRKLLPDWLLDHVLLRSSFERACYRFALKTLPRNDRHALFLGGFAGLGLVLGSQTMVAAVSRHFAHPVPWPNAGFLAVPMILAYFVICGLRFVFDLPAELSANWAPQAIVDREKHAAAPVARKIMLTLVWPWLLLIGLPLYAYFWGWQVALGHTAVVMVWSYCLAELLLRRFLKIPFTCRYSPWKQSATVIVIFYALGFVFFTSSTADLELALLQHHPWRLWLLAGAGLVAWKLFAKFREDELDPKELIFEEAPAPAIELLNLSGRLPYS